VSDGSTSLLWPGSSPAAQAALPDADLEEFYRYPEPGGRPYVRLNYVSSLTGKIAVGGQSAGLGTAGDKLVFGRLRRLADVILVGAGTVRAEKYRGARVSAEVRQQRRKRGQREVPPIAVLTATASLEPDGPLFTDASIPPIVLTTRSAPAGNVARLSGAGAEVVVVGDDHAETAQVLQALSRLGLDRILCEGGPSVFGDLLAADAVDEICMTLAPVAGGTGQVSADAPELRRLCLHSVLAAGDTLLLRYRRQASSSGRT
jgi:riboflavin biosynthesis pyrimidine reductase